VNPCIALRIPENLYPSADPHQNAQAIAQIKVSILSSSFMPCRSSLAHLGLGSALLSALHVQMLIALSPIETIAIPPYEA
jgi:hypothetical protein